MASSWWLRLHQRKESSGVTVRSHTGCGFLPVCEVERSHHEASTLTQCSCLLSHEASEVFSESLESLPRRFFWEILHSEGPAVVPLRHRLLFIRQVIPKDTHVQPSLEKPTQAFFHHLRMQNPIRLQGNVNVLCVCVNSKSLCRLNESQRSDTRCASFWGSSGWLPSLFFPLWTLIYTSGKAGGRGLPIPCLNLWRSWISESEGTQTHLISFL